MAHTSATVRITDEPTLRFTPGQDSKAVLNFRCAESHRKFDKQTNQWVDTGTTWRNVSLWGTKAENMAEILRQGDVVTIQGKESTRAWTGKNGNQGESLELMADEVGLVRRKGQAGQSPQGSGSRQAGQADPWSQQGGGNYDWGQPQSEKPPF